MPLRERSRAFVRTRRNFAAPGRRAFLLLGLLASACAPRGDSLGPVLLVTIDTLSADRVGCYGSPIVRTPYLDRLARRGLQVRDAISPAPLTAPSHATILTGVDPPRHGVRENAMFEIPDSTRTLAETLTADTRKGAFIGAFPVTRRFGFAQGFDVFDENFPAHRDRRRPPERPANAVLDPAAQWIESAASGARPFAWTHVFDPHYPHEAPQPWGAIARTLPGANGYEAEVAWVDSEVGRTLNAIRLGRHGGSLTVCIVADHGESLGAHGEITHALFVYDATQRVPLILVGPSIAARLERAPRRLADVGPTILACYGIVVPTGWEGVPLQDRTVSDEAYVETKHTELMRGWAPLHGMRTAQWKYIRAPRPELYDLKADPGETRNVYAEHPDVVTRLAARVDEVLAHESPTPATAMDEGTAEKLRSLGYVAAITDPGRADARKDPKDGAAGAAALFRGEDAYGRGDLIAARTHLMRAIELDPECKEAHSFLAGTYLSMGEPATAVDYARRALELEPHLNEGGVHGALGEALVRLGRGAEAIPHLREARRVRPRDPKLEQLLAEAQAATR